MTTPSDTDSLSERLFALTRRILDAIDTRDWESYRALCAPDLTSFEPEARGHCIEGMAFHEFFFEPRRAQGDRARSEIIGFRARALPEGDAAPVAAIVCYTRIAQRHDASGFRISHANETRVYARDDSAISGWRQVHFHRSAI